METLRSQPVVSSEMSELRPKVKILEIGSGGKSYFEVARLVKPRGDYQYFSLDLTLESLQVKKSDEKNFSVNADAQLLPFPDKTFDKIYLSNILNSLLVRYLLEAKLRREHPNDDIQTANFNMKDIRDLAITRSGRSKKPESFEEVNNQITDNIISEAWRVLKKNGKMIMIETYLVVLSEVYDRALKKLSADPRFSLVTRPLKKMQTF